MSKPADKVKEGAKTAKAPVEVKKVVSLKKGAKTAKAPVIVKKAANKGEMEKEEKKGDKSKFFSLAVPAPLPKGMFNAEKYKGTATENPHMKFRDAPWKFGMTVGQLIEFTEHCIAQPLWNQIKEMQANIGPPPNRVSGHLMNNHFVKHYTKDYGMGVALCMNGGGSKKVEIPKKGKTKEFENEPTDATVMLSWTYDSDMEAVVRVLKKKIDPESKVLLSTGKPFDKNTRVFFCLFANFQANGGKEKVNKNAPTTLEQVKNNPFKSIIQKVTDFMILQIHGEEFDLYKRKWCIYEIGIALTIPKMKVFWFPTKEYMTTHMDWHLTGENAESEDRCAVDSKKARCGGLYDEIMIDSDIEMALGRVSGKGAWKSGHDFLNEQVSKFRIVGVELVSKIFAESRESGYMVRMPTGVTGEHISKISYEFRYDWKGPDNKSCAKTETVTPFSHEAEIKKLEEKIKSDKMATVCGAQFKLKNNVRTAEAHAEVKKVANQGKKTTVQDVAKAALKKKKEKK